MPDLSQDQVEKRAAIQKTATIWAVIVGVIVGLIGLWILGGQASAIRFGGAAVAAAVVGFLVFRASFNSGAKSAKCAKCGAAFSRSRTDRQETKTGSADKEEREEQDDGSTKVTTWVEDSFDVVDTYTCAKCGDATTKPYQTTRRRDEQTVVEPAATATKTAQKSASTPDQDGQAAAGKTSASQAESGDGSKPGEKRSGDPEQGQKAASAQKGSSKPKR